MMSIEFLHVDGYTRAAQKPSKICSRLVGDQIKVITGKNRIRTKNGVRARNVSKIQNKNTYISYYLKSAFLGV